MREPVKMKYGIDTLPPGPIDVKDIYDGPEPIDHFFIVSMDKIGRNNFIAAIAALEDYRNKNKKKYPDGWGRHDETFQVYRDEPSIVIAITHMKDRKFYKMLKAFGIGDNCRVQLGR